MAAPMKRETRIAIYAGIVIALIFTLYQLRKAYHLGRTARPTQQVLIV